MKAPRLCGYCRQPGHNGQTCPMPEEWRGNWRQVQDDEQQAVKEMGRLLMEKVPRARWQRALFDALAVAQRIEDNAEREQFAEALRAIDQ